MSKLPIIVACFLVVSCSSVTQQSPNAVQEIPRATPEEVGMSSEALEKIGGLAQKYIDEGRVPGVVVGVSRRNKVVYLEALGILEEETQEPIPEDAIFIMASSPIRVSVNREHRTTSGHRSTRPSGVITPHIICSTSLHAAAATPGESISINTARPLSLPASFPTCFT